MDDLTVPAAPGFGLRLRRGLHPRRLAHARLRARENGSAFGFGVRLFGAIALTFTLIGVAGYVLIDRSLEHRQIENYAADLRADAQGFEAVGVRAA